MRNQKPQLLKHPILERFTRTNSFMAIVTYLSISMLVLVAGWSKVSLSAGGKLILVFAGILSFTLLEYLVHRYVYHSGEYLKPGRWQYKIHGVHHDFPKDKERLAMPIPLALSIIALLFLVFRSLLGSYVWAFLPGFLIGYGGYLAMHYIVHMYKPPQNVLKYLWIHHHLHHHQQQHKAFGVSSPLWDAIFGTLPDLTSTKVKVKAPSQESS